MIPKLEPRPDGQLIEEGDLSLCLLTNPRARTVRVIDFRVGPSPEKRRVVSELASRPGIERVFTLVEREEVSSWVRLGLAKEGVIPGFYKRTDAFVLGASVETLADPRGSGIHLTEKAQALALAARDKVMQGARARVERWSRQASPAIRLQVAPELETARRYREASSKGRALAGFEAFGRSTERVFYNLGTRSGFSLLVSVESQACFQNALIELLSCPADERAALLTARALGVLLTELTKQKVLSCFALTPSQDEALAAGFLQNGFRQTGLLPKHLRVGNTRHDATLWTRKLAPSGND